MDISNLSVKELHNLEKQISNTIESRKKEEKQELKRKIRAIAKEAGTSVEELFGLKGNSGRKRAKPAPKYRDPANPENTWSGRGRAPKWLQAKLDAGQTKEQFLIK